MIIMFMVNPSSQCMHTMIPKKQRMDIIDVILIIKEKFVFQNSDAAWDLVHFILAMAAS
jgi:hypothetical protein